MSFSKYGFRWQDGTDPLLIEFTLIRLGAEGLKKRGLSLFDHIRNAQSLLWPDDDHHRWSDLSLRSFCENDITVMMGSGDSNKTYSMARFILVDYWAFAEQTLWLISSTEYRGAELRIWGAIKTLFNRGKERYPWLAGSVLESMHAITTDEIDDDREMARSLRKGLILVPCKRGSQYVGLSAFIGVKSPRLRHAGDEVQAMTEGFLNAYANWYGKPDFKGIMAGNPTDPMDPLCVAGEPEGGWDTFIDTEKTQTWRSSFFDAFVIAFDGRDSPNFDFPSDQPVKYPYMINRKKLDAVAATWGKDSWQYYNQCIGKPNVSLALWRVITKQLCDNHRAHEQVIWNDESITSLYALDPAYGGGDRCVGMRLDFGKDVDGIDCIRFHEPEIIPISVKINVTPEDQIARYVFARSKEIGIPAENIFYDSFGKGTLGAAFARVFGDQTPVPIDSGGAPSARPVRFDLFIEEVNKTTGKKTKRLVRADEYYSKRVSEMWFSVRELIEGEQCRELSKAAMKEGCQRIYRIVKGNKTEVEPKEEMIERTGFSPDLFDTVAIGVEGARQRGFQIRRIGIDGKTNRAKRGPSMLQKEADEFSRLQRSKVLRAA